MHRTLRVRRAGEARTGEHAGRPRAAASLLALLLLPALARAADAPASDAPASDALAIEALAIDAAPEQSLPVGVPPPETPGIPPDAELEAAKAVVGEVLIDNQNICSARPTSCTPGRVRR